jgi:histidyl-tRNA synthetase
VIGKDSLSVRFDAEIPAVIHAVFSELDIGAFTIQMNNRKLMRGFFQAQGVADGELQALVLREVDKLDKRGEQHVRETLAGEGFNLSAEAVDRILAFVKVRSTSHADAIAKLDALGEATTLARRRGRTARSAGTGARAGVPEAHYALNFSIARGLDYYTGTVYETTLDDYPQIGSICSGGRYENLASHYTKSKLAGRRHFDRPDAPVLAAARSRPARNRASSTVQALVTQMDASLLPHACASPASCAGGFNTEVVMEARKLGKQFKYADRAGIRFVSCCGEDEIAKGRRRSRICAARTVRGRAPELASTLRWNSRRPRHCPASTASHEDDPSLDGRSLTRASWCGGRGAQVELAPTAARRGTRAEFLAEQVAREEPIYGVSPASAAMPTACSARIACATSCPARAARGNAARRTAAQPDRHPRGVRGRAVRAGDSPRDAVHPHQHADARALGHPRGNPAGADLDAQCRHRAGGAAAGFGRRVGRSRAAVASGDRAARRR